MKQFSKNAIHAFEIHGDKVILTKPYELTIDDWQLIMARFNRLGYGLSDVNQTIDVYERLTQEGKRGGCNGYQLQKDQAEAVLSLLERDELKVCVISNDTKEAVTTVAEDYFKCIQSSNLYLAGYLTIHGNFLNFSYDYRARNIDHRDIYDAIEDFITPEKRSEYNAAMNFFMNCGNIRLTGNGIDLICEPNEQQVDKLYDYFEDLKTRERVIAVDYSNEDGHCVGSTSYDMENIPVSTIIRDIKGYFKDYTVPIDKGFAIEQEAICKQLGMGYAIHIPSHYVAEQNIEQEDDYERD